MAARGIEFILDWLAAGQSEADIVANFPGLAHEFKAYPLPV